MGGPVLSRSDIIVAKIRMESKLVRNRKPKFAESLVKYVKEQNEKKRPKVDQPEGQLQRNSGK